jgi:hypothetical protein
MQRSGVLKRQVVLCEISAAQKVFASSWSVVGERPEDGQTRSLINL